MSYILAEGVQIHIALENVTGLVLQTAQHQIVLFPVDHGYEYQYGIILVDETVVAVLL